MIDPRGSPARSCGRVLSSGALILIASAGLALQCRTHLASVSTSGVRGNGDSLLPSISANGRFVAFTSRASNLVADDTNGTEDVFVRDLQAGTTERVSVSSSGRQGDHASFNRSISPDGRYVAFQSGADTLVDGDTNTLFNQDIFVRDRATGTTTRVSVDSDGNESNGFSDSPAISADGRFVAFESKASNLVPNDTNRCPDPANCTDGVDVFVHDMQTGVTERVSVDSDGGQANDDSGGPAISADGRYVAFSSSATNLVADDTNVCVDEGSYPCPDAFVHDRQTGVTERVSVANDGSQADGSSGAASMSDDGRFVLFSSTAPNLVDDGYGGLFMRDREAGTTGRVEGGGGTRVAMSGDARYVTLARSSYYSPDGCRDFGSPCLDIFLIDRQSGTTERVTVDPVGNAANRGSLYSSVSLNGTVAFDSDASNLVVGDDAWRDIFVRSPGGTVAGVSTP